MKNTPTYEELTVEVKRLREALRQYAVRENWEYGKRQWRNVWNQNYEDGFKLAEETLSEGRQWPGGTNVELEGKHG